MEVEAGLLREVLNGGLVMPKTRHPKLSRVYGKELTDLKHHHQAVPIDQPKQWGEDNGCNKYKELQAAG